jgi:uncharacterized damage-inducible protein DinB
MKTKEALLIQLESQVEQHLELAIHLFQNQETAVLLKQPHSTAWSIAQCLWHLNSYGHFYLPHIQQVLASTNASPNYKSGWLGAYFIKMMKPGANKQKFKALKNHIPPPIPDAYAVVAEFIEQQETLLRYVKQAFHADLNKRLPISITNLITLKLGDVLQFVVTHDERHLQQALKNIDQRVEA